MRLKQIVKYALVFGAGVVVGSNGCDLDGQALSSYQPVQETYQKNVQEAGGLYKKVSKL